jgi:aryl-alcohol dehydrogenase-like predicted oxidoreductase/NAD-dependent dihydropyrimidine dehydrogenase PreA subunit
METVRLGRTGLVVNKAGFGALPIQRVDMAEARRILCRAVDGGVNFIDTARGYTDSEEKLGAALDPALRKRVFLATKFRLSDGEALMQSLHASLKTLRTEYVDILQAHNPKRMPAPDDGSGCYEALLEARRAGKIRYIGLSAHSLDVAVQAAGSGLYDTVQFPFSYLSSGRDLEMPGICRDADVGFLAMKVLAGGLIRNIPAAFAFMRGYENVLPLWGIQKMEELEEFLALGAVPPVWNAEMEAAVAKDRRELGGEFCRGCGYCMPCPTGIDISLVARMELYLGRQPLQRVVEEGGEKMAKAVECTQCGECRTRCPYGLDTPELVRKNTEFYLDYLRRHGMA